MTRLRRALYISVILLFSASCTPQPTGDEKKPGGLKNMAPPSLADQVFENLDNEPNDTMLQATDVTLSGDELHFTGKLTPGDTDTWRIKAKSGTIVNITVTPQNFDVITDFSPIDKESARRVYDEHAAGEEVLTNLRLTPQGGYLTVRGRNTEEVTYTVSVHRILAHGDEIIEQEPNDDLAAAQPLWPDRDLNATLNPSDDVDFFKLNQNKPGILSCDFGQQAVSFKIVQNQKIVYQAESVPGDPVRTPALQAASDLYARIESLTPSQDATPYRCRLTALDTIPNEVEPNDSPETAQKILDNADDVEFSFMSASDIDIFRVTSPPDANRRYSARIEASDGVSATLNVLSDSGSPLVQTTGSRACLFGVDAGQDFLLRVAHAPTNKTYPLAYRLRMSSLLADQTEAEPNNASTEATPIMPGKTLHGFIFPETDVDFYRLDLFPERLNLPSEPTAYSGAEIEVTTASGYIAHLNIRIQDASGYEITRVESQQASRPLKLAYFAPWETYYIVVSGQGDQCLKPYALHVSVTPKLSENAAPAAAPDLVGTDALPAEPPSADMMPTGQANETASGGEPSALPPNPQPASGNAPDTAAEDEGEVNIDLLLQAAGSKPVAPPSPAVPPSASKPADAAAPVEAPKNAPPTPSPKPAEDEDAF